MEHLTRNLLAGCMAATVMVGAASAQTRDQNAATCKDGQPDAAIKACTALITGHTETQKGIAIAYNNRASAYINKKENDKAIADLDAAIRIDHGYATAHFNRGIALVNKGQLQDGIKAYDQALRYNPKYVGALNNRGSAYDDLGQYQRAIQDYNLAIQIDPTDSIGINNRGVAYKNLGQYRQALPDMDRAIAMGPEKPNRWANRCWVKAILGELEAARSDCEQSLKINSTYGYAREARGVLNIKLKNADAAIDDFTVAIAAWGRDAIAFYGRGVAKRMKGDSAGADADTASARGFDSNIEAEFAKFDVKTDATH